MKIAIEGCCHGSLDQIYKAVSKKKIDLLLICGDFQSIRNRADLYSMSVPDKYKKIGDFQKYYTGEAKAPVFTIFIGGNHEASQYLDELKYGGFVAPNIYYMGRTSVVWYKGLRIGGISGIYYQNNFMKPRPKQYSFPLDSSNLRSIYHYRKDDYFKLRILDQCNKMLMLSHDWPEGIYNYGDVEKLIRMKPFFKNDTKKHTLGSPFLMNILHSLRPKNWFSAHLHVKFTGKVKWNEEDAKKREISEGQKINKARKRRKCENIADNNEIKLDMSSDETEATKEVEISEVSKSDEIKLDISSENESIEENSSAKETVKKNEDEIDLSLEMSEVEIATNNDDRNPTTEFLSLDKCLAKREWLQIMTVEPTDPNHISNQNKRMPFFYDEEYIAAFKAVEDHKSKIDELSYDETLRPSVELLEEFKVLKDYYLQSFDRLDEEKRVELFNIPMQKWSFKKPVSEKLKVPEIVSNPQTEKFASKFL